MGYCAGFLFKQEPFFISFLLAGLIGSFTHCVSMCGSFMACEVMCHSSSCNNKNNKTGLSFPAQIFFHLGRATTYGCLGFLAALLSRQIAAYSFWPYLSAALLVIAGAIFIISSLPGCRHKFSAKLGKRSFFSGALLGFMPCSLIYALLMVAATTANPVMAMVGMWIFVLGTTPALFLVGAGAAKITQKWREMAMKCGNAMMAVNGLVLFIMAIKLVR